MFSPSYEQYQNLNYQDRILIKMALFGIIRFLIYLDCLMYPLIYYLYLFIIGKKHKFIHNYVEKTNNLVSILFIFITYLCKFLSSIFELLIYLLFFKIFYQFSYLMQPFIAFAMEFPSVRLLLF